MIPYRMCCPLKMTNRCSNIIPNTSYYFTSGVVTLYKGDLRSRFRGLAASRYGTGLITFIPLLLFLFLCIWIVTVDLMSYNGWVGHKNGPFYHSFYNYSCFFLSVIFVTFLDSWYVIYIFLMLTVIWRVMHQRLWSQLWTSLLEWHQSPFTHQVILLHYYVWLTHFIGLFIKKTDSIDCCWTRYCLFPDLFLQFWIFHLYRRWVGCYGF